MDLERTLHLQVQDAGLQTKFIITKAPQGAPVTERAVPTAIFAAEPAQTRHYLRLWLRAPQQTDFSLREVP